MIFIFASQKYSMCIKINSFELRVWEADDREMVRDDALLNLNCTLAIPVMTLQMYQPVPTSKNDF